MCGVGMGLFKRVGVRGADTFSKCFQGHYFSI